jgi:hypothetical protein
VRLLIAVASAAMVIYPAVVAFGRRSELEWQSDWPLLGLGLGGLIILSIDYTLAYQDALRSVIQFNESAESRFEDEHPDAP